MPIQGPQSGVTRLKETRIKEHDVTAGIISAPRQYENGGWRKTIDRIIISAGCVDHESQKEHSSITLTYRLGN